jgi:hypothetical protein
MKKTSNSGHDNGLSVLAFGAFLLTALVFLYLLYFGQALVGSSSGMH